MRKRSDQAHGCEEEQFSFKSDKDFKVQVSQEESDFDQQFSELSSNVHDDVKEEDNFIPFNLDQSSPPLNIKIQDSEKVDFYDVQQPNKSLSLSPKVLQIQKMKTDEIDVEDDESYLGTSVRKPRKRRRVLKLQYQIIDDSSSEKSQTKCRPNSQKTMDDRLKVISRSLKKLQKFLFQSQKNT